MMLFRLTGTRWGDPPREMDVPMTREQVADWLNGIDLVVAAPRLTEGQREFLMQGALLCDDELVNVMPATRGSALALPLASRRLRSALAAWYAADGRARDLETRVHQASLQREADGTPVCRELLREMLRARDEANVLLRAARSTSSSGQPKT
jgi:hypothetical protein